MAPRTPVSTPPPAGELADRIRQQREAAERMAEQRVAEAKIRAAQENREGGAPGFLSTGAANVHKPRFTFAEEELKQAQQDSAAQGRAWSSPSIPGRQTRPVFTADRPRPPEARNRPPAVPTRATSPGTAPQSPPPRAPITGQPRPQTGLTQSSYPSQGVNDPRWQPGQRPRTDSNYSSPESYRSATPPAASYGLNDHYADEAGYRGGPQRRDPVRARGDFRGAHSRELAHVEDDAESVFEDERKGSSERKRAGAEEYTQAYREYDGLEEQGPRRRMGPFLLLLALLGVAATAGAVIVVYKHSGGGSPQSAEGAVPVIAEPAQPAKTPPESGAAQDETAQPDQSAAATQQPEVAPSTQKKQIYDRILGDSTAGEQNQLAPSEEQPVVPNASGDSGTDPVPIPMPPPPGGSADQPSGALDEPASTQQASSGDGSGQTVTDTKSAADSGIATPDSQTADSTATGTAAESESASQPSANSSSAPVPPKQKIKTAAETASTTKIADSGAAPVAASDGLQGGSGSGPIQITPIQGEGSPASPGTTFTPQPALPALSDTGTVPNTIASPARTIGRRAGDRFVSSANTNFNRSSQAAPQQVATIEPVPTAPQASLPAVNQTTEQPAQQASLPQENVIPAVKTPAGAAGYILQLSSFRSEAEAKAQYDRLRQQHGTVIAGLTPEIQKADLGSRGTYYRLFLGTVSSKPAATTLCNSLFGVGERDCLVKAR